MKKSYCCLTVSLVKRKTPGKRKKQRNQPPNQPMLPSQSHRYHRPSQYVPVPLPTVKKTSTALLVFPRSRPRTPLLFIQVRPSNSSEYPINLSTKRNSGIHHV